MIPLMDRIDQKIGGCTQSNVPEWALVPIVGFQSIGIPAFGGVFENRDGLRIDAHLIGLAATRDGGRHGEAREQVFHDSLSVNSVCVPQLWTAQVRSGMTGILFIPNLRRAGVGSLR
jgi:hypothetical protein